MIDASCSSDPVTNTAEVTAETVADTGGVVGDKLGDEWFEEGPDRIQQLVAAAINATPILRASSTSLESLALLLLTA